jgi:hypothetical protein
MSCPEKCREVEMRCRRQLVEKEEIRDAVSLTAC